MYQVGKVCCKCGNYVSIDIEHKYKPTIKETLKEYLSARTKKLKNGCEVSTIAGIGHTHFSKEYGVTSVRQLAWRSHYGENAEYEISLQCDTENCISIEHMYLSDRRLGDTRRYYNLEEFCYYRSHKLKNGCIIHRNKKMGIGGNPHTEEMGCHTFYQLAFRLKYGFVPTRLFRLCSSVRCINPEHYSVRLPKQRFDDKLDKNNSCEIDSVKRRYLKYSKIPTTNVTSDRFWQLDIENKIDWHSKEYPMYEGKRLNII